MTAPSTGTTSPFRTTRRSPGSITSKSTSSSRPLRWRTAVCGTERRHLPACAALGKILEVLPAGIHQSDHDGGEVFGKDQCCQHRQCGHDVQPDIAAAQADDDLHHEREQDRDRGDGPYRAGPMRPSRKLRREPDDEASRGPCDDQWSKKAANVYPRPKSVQRL